MSRDMDDLKEALPRGRKQAKDLSNIEDTDDFEIVKGPAGDDFEAVTHPAEDDFEAVDVPAAGDFESVDVSAEDDFETVDLSARDDFEAVKKPVKSNSYVDDEFEQLLRKHAANGGYDADTRSKAERYLDHLYELDDEAYREAAERVSNNPLASEVRARAYKSVEDDRRAQKLRRDEEDRMAREHRREEKEAAIEAREEEREAKRKAKERGRMAREELKEEKSRGRHIPLIILLLLILILGGLCIWLYFFPELALSDFLPI